MKILEIGSRFAVFEREGNTCYYSKYPCEISLDEREIQKIDTNVFTLFDLKPDQDYTLTMTEEGKKTTLSFRTKAETACLDVTLFGAVGDGKKDCTTAINGAISCCPEGGCVYVPKGIYMVTTVWLRSKMQIYLEKDAVIKAIPDREKLAILPGLLSKEKISNVWEDSTEDVLKKKMEITYPLRENENFGTWEGNPVSCFAAVVTGVNVREICVAGEGTIDGSGNDGDWWENPVVRRISWRPRTLFLNGCKDMTFVGITVTNSPSWTVHPYYCVGVKFYQMFVKNPQISPNTDGIDPESCKNVEIVGTRISVGDDCIAIKSGRIDMAKTYLHESKDIQIRNCLLECGHGGVVVGSEIACGVHNVKVKQCLMRGTDRGFRVKTQRGRGKKSVVSNIVFENVIMEQVKAAFTVNMFYYWGPEGHSDYMQNRSVGVANDSTPKVETLYCRNVTCTDCEVAAGYFLGLPEMPIEGIKMENVTFSFSESAESGEPVMADGVGLVKKLGIYAENVKQLELSEVNIFGHEGELLQLRNVDTLVQNEKGYK